MEPERTSNNNQTTKHYYYRYVPTPPSTHENNQLCCVTHAIKINYRLVISWRPCDELTWVVLLLTWSIFLLIFFTIIQGGRPFVCGHCSSRFRQKHHLVAHTLVHTEVRPHKCEVCGSGFKHKWSMTAHIKKMHNVMNY